MGVALNIREKAVLTAIMTSIRSRGYPPSVREIGQEVGLLSSSTVHGYLKRLQDKGYLRRDESKPRAMEVINPPDPFTTPATVELPVFGRLDAAKPPWADENRRGTFVLPKHFLGEGSFFILDVEEESPIGVGFLPGDMVIVREQSSAQEGDVVVASDGETTCVICAYRENTNAGLFPDRESIPPEEMNLAGKLVALVRRIG